MEFSKICALTRCSDPWSGVNLISDALPFGRLWYGEPNAVTNAIDYAKFYSRSHDAVIRIYDDAGNVFQRGSARADFPGCIADEADGILSTIGCRKSNNAVTFLVRQAARIVAIL
jgi:hypothetical protein